MSKAHKWKRVVAILGSLIGVGLLIGLGTYLYISYKNHPVPQSELFGVALEMEPVDVLLALGEPTRKDTINNDQGEDTIVYGYQTLSWGGIDKVVRFKNDNDTLRVSAICDLSPGGELYGLYSFSNEDEVIKKFGKPSSESISSDGLRKFLTFGPLNVAVEIEKRLVTTVCVTNRDTSYINEYAG